MQINFFSHHHHIVAAHMGLVVNEASENARGWEIFMASHTYLKCIIFYITQHDFQIKGEYQRRRFFCQFSSS